MASSSVELKLGPGVNLTHPKLLFTFLCFNHMKYNVIIQIKPDLSERAFLCCVSWHLSERKIHLCFLFLFRRPWLSFVQAKVRFEGIQSKTHYLSIAVRQTMMSIVLEHNTQHDYIHVYMCLEYE